MEAMMRGRAGGMPGVSKTEYRKAGTDKVGRWTCDKYQGYLNNQKVSELCTVDPKSLGFAVSDFEVARQLGEFFKGMMPQNLTPQNLDRVFAVGRVEAEGFAGLPVRRITYANGNPVDRRTDRGKPPELPCVQLRSPGRLSEDGNVRRTRPRPRRPALT